MRDWPATHRPERDEDVFLVLPPDRVVGNARCHARYVPGRRGGAPELFIQLMGVRWDPGYVPPMEFPVYRLRFADGTELAGSLDSPSAAVLEARRYRFLPRADGPRKPS